jgi:fibronectin type 3 domain-containing protein
MLIGIVTKGTSFNDSDVIIGINYYYVITAVNTVGESDFSNEVSAKLMLITTTTASFPHLCSLLGLFGIIAVLKRKRK